MGRKGAELLKTLFSSSLFALILGNFNNYCILLFYSHRQTQFLSFPNACTKVNITKGRISSLSGRIFRRTGRQFCKTDVRRLKTMGYVKEWVRPTARHRHQGRYLRHWHSGNHHRSAAPVHFGTGLGLLILVPRTGSDIDISFNSGTRLNECGQVSIQRMHSKAQ
jgi:hypothetical protein